MNTSSSSIPVIEIHPRLETGSRSNKRLRAQGLIPSIVYHRGEDSVPGSLVQRDFLKIAGQSRSSQIFALKSSDKRLDGKTALVKQINRDYLDDAVLHVDFQSLKDDEEIVVRIPLKIQGEAYGVKNENGILTVAFHDVGVRCLPRMIPNQVVVDVSELHLGQSIHASDLPLPSGVVLDDDADETIVSVVAIRVVEETPAVTEAAVTEEAAAAGTAQPGAAAQPAAGAQPAQAASADKKKEKK